MKGTPTRVLVAAVLLGLAAPAAGFPPGGPGNGRGAARLATALPALHAEPDPIEGGRIVDSHGREVLLRGVNVNSFVEYWAHDPSLFTTYPLTEADARRIASVGWNVVRLLISWSRVEPAPGVYDDAYIDEVEEAVRLLARYGLYSIIDLHQDAWGPTLAGAPDEPCPGGEPAFGWDGAPGWATLDGEASRCLFDGTRELSPAVMAAFMSFWNDDEGPGGVGIRTRYARMLGYLARRLAPHDAVAGYDLMNEPNALFSVLRQFEAMSQLYAEALAEIRVAEASVGAPRRLVFFEPSILWADFGVGAPPPFAHDGQIVYAPHLYQGGINSVPLTREVFEDARSEAAAFGGAPVLSGEWGADPRRASNPEDDYFARHQALQDEFRFGATLWTYREACGDPHKASDFRWGREAFVWGLYDVDCATNEDLGLREDLVRALTRPYVRAAPGRFTSIVSDPGSSVLTATGVDAPRGSVLVAFLPGGGGRPWIRARGLSGRWVVEAPGGHYYVVARALGGAWSLEIRPRRRGH
jgi:endoglycosylceramidase